MDTPTKASQPATLKRTLKNKKIVAVLLAALLSCGVATYGLYSILTPQRTTVYTFNDNYSAGTLVTQEMLTPVEIDNTLISGSTQQSAGDYFVTDANFKSVITSAGVLRADVYSGNALMTSMLTTTSGNSIEMTMKQNAVAVTVAANFVTAVTDELAAGSRVNVYASYEDSTTLLLQNIRVLSVGREGGTINSVTLEVNIAQSLQLVHANTFGTVQLGLVDATGYEYSQKDMPTYSTSGFTSN